MAFSEFGRRPEENGSLGTDHGTAGPVFLAGPSGEGRSRRQDAPARRPAGRRPEWSIDFRSVYATLLDQWLNLPRPRSSAGTLILCRCSRRSPPGGQIAKTRRRRVFVGWARRRREPRHPGGRCPHEGMIGLAQCSIKGRNALVSQAFPAPRVAQLSHHVATWLNRYALLPRWANEAALTPASAGAFGRCRLRMHSTQLVRCGSSVHLVVCAQGQEQDRLSAFVLNILEHDSQVVSRAACPATRQRSHEVYASVAMGVRRRPKAAPMSLLATSTRHSETSAMPGGHARKPASVTIRAHDCASRINSVAVIAWH